MTNTQAIAILVAITAAIMFTSHDWVGGGIAVALVATPALLIRHKRA
jgi:hypothetical protein